MYSCPICGSSESNNWVICKQYPSAEDNGFKGSQICMIHCMTCSFHIKDGTSLEWCGYRLPQSEQAGSRNREIPVNSIEMQIREKIEKAEYYYKRGKTRIAERLSDEAAHMEINLRKMKNDERKDA